ncbi:MAG TPA: hydroxysqualene dehydroxylase HpnE [Terriglobales bacterium]|nr:hydroxysqualene dehydroxylase HpnE [Terriglobales bacterium]
MTPPQTKKTVAIVGGGLAGLAAGCALVEAGFAVRLYERRPYLGGRASSYQHPGTGEVVDNCQHVLLGCCTNLIDFYRRTGTEGRIHWFEQLLFLEPGGRQSVIQPSFLPAPLHAAPSFLAASALSLRDKLGIASAMVPLRQEVSDDSRQSFLDWLRRHGQTQRAIERFWKVVLVSALNEDLERSSAKYAAQVFRESFLKSREGGRMGIPAVPLSDLYGAAGEYIASRGGEVSLRCPVEGFSVQAKQVVIHCGGQQATADYLVLAAPFNGLAQLLPEGKESERLREALSRFESSPITGVHLWFDREITDLEHAVLLDRTIQWMFHKSKLLGRSDPGSYVELVISSSKQQVEMGRQEIIDLALRELAEFFPKAAEARLEKATVIKEVHATYSPRPGVDEYRTGPQSEWPRVFLAGDWTATGWPATMEGAVRSGYLAAEALCQTAGQARRFLVSGLAATGLSRLLM